MTKKPTMLNRSARPLGRLATLAALIATAGCITVNVNFPESAVQRAADDFVKDLYKNPTAVADTGAAGATAESQAVKNAVKKSGAKKTGKVPAAVPSTPAEPAKTEPKPTSFFDLLIPAAYAQEINTSTPKAQAIKDRMRGRVGAISVWKAKGVVCETQDATLLVKNPGKAGADAGTVTRLVQAENRDRDELYEEIQTANKITDRKQTRIRKFFAAAFRENSPPGTCIEKEDGSWSVK